MDISMTAGFLAPLPAIIVIFTRKEYEFAALGFPPTLCGSKDFNVAYYSLVLVINIIFIIGLPMLVYLLWILHKVRESMILSLCF